MGYCATYCEHGGICELSAGHTGPHDTGYCTFTDEQAVSKTIADAELIKKGGGDIVATQDILMGLAEALEDDGG